MRVTAIKGWVHGRIGRVVCFAKAQHMTELMRENGPDVVAFVPCRRVRMKLEHTVRVESDLCGDHHATFRIEGGDRHGELVSVRPGLRHADPVYDSRLRKLTVCLADLML